MIKGGGGDYAKLQHNGKMRKGISRIAAAMIGAVVPMNVKAAGITGSRKTVWTGSLKATAGIVLSVVITAVMFNVTGITCKAADPPEMDINIDVCTDDTLLSEEPVTLYSSENDGTTGSICFKKDGETDSRPTGTVAQFPDLGYDYIEILYYNGTYSVLFYGLKSGVKIPVGIYKATFKCYDDEHENDDYKMIHVTVNVTAPAVSDSGSGSGSDSGSGSAPATEEKEEEEHTADIVQTPSVLTADSVQMFVQNSDGKSGQTIGMKALNPYGNAKPNQQTFADMWLLKAGTLKGSSVNGKKAKTVNGVNAKAELLWTYDLYPTYGLSAKSMYEPVTLAIKNSGAKAGDIIYVEFYNEKLKVNCMISATVGEDGSVTCTLPCVGDVSTISVVRIN